MVGQKNNVVLLHGRWPEKINDTLVADIPLCDPNNEGNWMGRTKKQLEEKGYSVTCPVIVDAWKARWEQWKKELDKLTIDENTILVGLSAGGYALARYLGETKKLVKKLILVAPSWQAGDGPEPLDSRVLLPNEDEFYSYKITPELRSQITDGVNILVSNDSESILKSIEMYKEVLGAKEIKLEGLGHFSFLIKEIPELLNEISITDSKPELRETRRGFESQF